MRQLVDTPLGILSMFSDECERGVFLEYDLEDSLDTVPLVYVEYNQRRNSVCVIRCSERGRINGDMTEISQRDINEYYGCENALLEMRPSDVYVNGKHNPYPYEFEKVEINTPCGAIVVSPVKYGISVGLKNGSFIKELARVEYDTEVDVIRVDTFGRDDGSFAA